MIPPMGFWQSWSKRRKVGVTILVTLVVATVGFGIWWVVPKYHFPEAVNPTVLFKQGEAGYHTFRIPGIVTLPGGTVIAVCEGRQNSVSDYGDIDLVLKRSTDDGKTWSALAVLWDDPELSLSNPCPVYDAETKVLFLHVVYNRSDHYVLNSTDAGVTWSTPSLLDLGEPGWTFQGPAPGHGIRLLSGRLLVPGMYHSKPNAEDESQWSSYFFYSDDHGKTWVKGHDFGLGTNEFLACELSNGTVLSHLRSNRELGYDHKLVSWSNDGGITSSPTMLDEELVTPICMSGLLALPNNVVVFSNPAHASQRKDFTLKVSKDGGDTWPIAKKLYSGPAAYSDLTRLASGEIGVLVERGQTMYQETITFLRVPTDYLGV